MIVASILFYIFSIGAIAGFLLIKKSDAKHSLFVWLPMSIMVLLCLDALVAGIFSLLHIPISIISIGIFHALFSVACFANILKTGKRQQFEFTRIDVVAGAVCLVVVLACAYIQFGFNFDLHYATIDPAVHLARSLDIYSSGQLSSMYFAHLPIAMVIQTISPFVSYTQLSAAYIFCDVGFLYLSGMLFYALTRRFISSTKTGIAVIILLLLYTLAYPLNNMVIGFCYLGMGVSLVALLYFSLDLLVKGTLPLPLSVAMSSLALLGLIICYALFAPFVYLAAFIVLLVHFQKQGRIFSIKNLAIAAALFIPGLIYGIIFVWLSIFSAVSFGQALATDGFVYRDLYSNFILCAPFALYGLYLLLKQRRFDMEVVLFAVLTLTMLAALIGGLFDLVSSYYFYKFHYLMWLAVFVLAARGLAELLATEAKKLVFAYGAVWALVALMAVSTIDSSLYKYDPLFNSENKSWSYLDIYEFNVGSMMGDEELAAAGNFQTKEKLAFYEQALSYRTGNTVVPLVSDFNDVFWYQGITDQNMLGFFNWQMPVEEYRDSLASAEYVAVVYDSEAEGMAALAGQDLEVVYEDAVGYIAKMGD